MAPERSRVPATFPTLLNTFFVPIVSMNGSMEVASAICVYFSTTRVTACDGLIVYHSSGALFYSPFFFDCYSPLIHANAAVVSRFSKTRAIECWDGM